MRHLHKILPITAAFCIAGLLMQSCHHAETPEKDTKFEVTDTLLKSLLANYPGLAEKDFTLDSGAVFWGHEAQIGYFPQDVGSTIEHGLTVAEWLHRWNPAAHVEEIRGIPCITTGLPNGGRTQFVTSQ